MPMLENPQIRRPTIDWSEKAQSETGEAMASER